MMTDSDQQGAASLCLHPHSDHACQSQVCDALNSDHYHSCHTHHARQSQVHLLLLITMLYTIDYQSCSERCNDHNPFPAEPPILPPSFFPTRT